MLKRILIVCTAIIVLFLIALNTHTYFNNSSLTFSIRSVYSFHVIATLIVYVVVELVANKLPSQAGYAYLMLMFFKIGAFVLIFQEEVFAKTQLNQSEKIALVVPLFIFLIAEAIAVGKLLNSK